MTGYTDPTARVGFTNDVESGLLAELNPSSAAPAGLNRFL